MQLVCCPAAERVVQPASVLLSSCPSFVRSSMSSSICLILSLLLCLLLSGSEARISPRMDSPLCSHARVSSAALNIQLDAWGGDSIRVRISPDSIVQTPDIQALLPTPPATLPPAAAQPCGSTAPGQLSHGNLEVSVSDDGSISATRRSDGLQLIASSAPSFLPFKTQGIYPQLQSLYSVTLSYSHAAGQVYGLGEHKTGSQRYSGYSHLFEHSQVYSYSEGGDISIPFYLSQAAFAVLLNEPGYGSISIDSQAAVWSFNATHQLDLWISTFPADLAEDASPFPSLSSHYAEVTGFPNPLPHFASGFWQSKNRYRNQSEVLGVAAEFHRRHVPLTVYVIDAGSWRYLGDWSFADTSNCWQDVTAMVQTLAGYGMHVMTSAWPRLDPNSSHYAEFASNGWLTKDGQGRDLVNAQDGHTFLYNAFDPAARQALWSALVSGYVQYGIQLFWLDAAEPEGSRPGEQWWSGRSDREIGMAWSLHHSRMIWEGSLAAGIPVSSIIVLSRHGWVGSPLTNTFVWSGDTHSTWEAFNTQVRLAPNVGISGIHWWATDIGGYYSGQPSHTTGLAPLSASPSAHCLCCCCPAAVLRRRVAVGGVERAAGAMVPMGSLPAHLPHSRLPRADAGL